MAKNPHVTVKVYPQWGGTGRGTPTLEWKAQHVGAETLGKDLVDGLIERGWDAEMWIVRESDEVYPPKPEEA